MLLDELKKMKEELEKGENPEEAEKAEEVAEDIEEAAEEEATQAGDKEPEKEREAEKSEEKREELDNAGYARLRREAAAEKSRAETERLQNEQLRQEIAELRAAKEAPIIEQIPLSPELQSVVEDNRMSRAEREFAILENKAQQAYPEYGAVATEYAAAMYQSIRMQNPRKSEIELNEMTKKAILMKAGEYARLGYENPVEEMYHEARELGFTGKAGKSFKGQEAAGEEKIEPDLKKVAENRKRSSGMAATNGRSEGQMTVGAAADLTAAEWAKLPVSEKKRLMYG